MLAPTFRRKAMSRRFHYGQLMHAALRGLMTDVLADVAENGLPGDHHFFITFDTNHAGVDIPPSLKARYPEEMTIVLQDWFQDLTVMRDRFAVTLNFGDVPETLVIPFNAISTFVDPSVEFGLRFDSAETSRDDDPDGAEDAPEDEAAPDADKDAPAQSGDVVSLDRFRKT